MKKLLLLLLIAPVLLNGQLKFADEFLISNDFVEVNQKTYIELLSDAVSYTNTSDNRKNEIFNEMRNNHKLFKRRGTEEFEENIIIGRSKLSPSWDMLDYLNANFEKLGAEALPSETTLEMIDSGISTLYGFNYVFINTLFNLPAFERFSTTCIISVNNKNYKIIINSFDNLSLSDVIIKIIE